MKNRTKLLILTGGLLGFLSVLFGAFGSHILKDKLSTELFDAYKTGILYNLVHSVLIAAIATSQNHKLFSSAFFFIFGIILFSFSLYLYAITQIRILTIITPFGGVCFLIGWILLVIKGFSTKSG
jgi:uncharacterized membrane protein YgdD (TMEM256/DUF423 family)